MHPIVSDPHNHVPEVSSDDLWGDAEDLPLLAYRPSTILPPRRPPAEASSPTATGARQEGLRIESTPQRRPADEASTPLDVQKIDGSVIRLDPEAPTQPRMPRQEVKPQPAFKKVAGAENSEWGRNKKLPIRWVLGIGLLTLSLVVASLTLLPRINRANAIGNRPGQISLTLDTTDAIEDAVLIEQLLNLQPQAGDLFKKYMTAATADDLATVVRDPQSIIPLIPENERSVLISARWSPSEGAGWNVLPANGKPFGILSGTYPDFSKFNACFVIEENQLRLDWKATSGYGTATFDELAANQGDPAEIRASITPSDYYSPVFPETEFRSYQLFSPDNTKAVWCYARRGSAVAESLDGLFSSGTILKAATTPQRVTVRLERGPEGALQNQWLVAEILHEDWISP
jgi:hypothetical protein